MDPLDTAQRASYYGLRAFAVTLCLAVGAAALAQQPTASPSQQPTAAPVPSIEELKRLLEEKRRQLEESKKQPKPHPVPEAGAAAAAAASKPSSPVPAAAGQPSPKSPSPIPAAATPPPAAAPTPAPAAPRAPPHAAAEGAAPPPLGKAVAPVRLDPRAPSANDSCPYPEVARNRGDTGTVVLLIYVAPDGRATDTKIESSSGSDVLDDAAASCVKEFGRFVPKRVGSRAQAGWFRMRFTWSFGDL